MDNPLSYTISDTSSEKKTTRSQILIGKKLSLIKNKILKMNEPESWIKVDHFFSNLHDFVDTLSGLEMISKTLVI